MQLVVYIAAQIYSKYIFGPSQQACTRQLTYLSYITGQACGLVIDEVIATELEDVERLDLFGFSYVYQ